MSQILKQGQQVRAVASPVNLEVEKLLGGGGQGEVYSVRYDKGTQPMALKWYFPHTATAEQRAALETIIKKGSPTPHFLWPETLVEEPGLTGFGYLMRLREPNYVSIVDLLKGRAAPSFFNLAKAGRELAHNFYELHAKGLCYRDISFGNVFFNPDNGQVLICDNDNVALDGTATSGVLGTPRFMAPEVVRGEARPDTQTDLFSLAVLLFYMLMVHHPLEGAKEANIRCFDLPAMKKLYGFEPLFIFDPRDTSNRPVKGYQDNALIYWGLYPQFIKKMFTRAFTDGIKDPQHGRVREGEWRNALIRLGDSIFKCSNCDSENFFDAESSQDAAKCWDCHKPTRPTFALQLGRGLVMLNSDTKLYPHHLDNQKSNDFSKEVAIVNSHPTNPNIKGLKNLSGQKWIATMPDGTTREIEPGNSLTLRAGTRLHFGSLEGEILSL